MTKPIKWLKDISNLKFFPVTHINAVRNDNGDNITEIYAPLNNPVLTGTPTAPTPSSTDDSTRIATTAFVKDIVGDMNGSNILYTGEEPYFLENGTTIDEALDILDNTIGSLGDNTIARPSSSTDNAIVRFDGTQGDIQNSGVTINDSNHVTAAKFITSGGTSSQFVKGDGSVDSTTYAPLASPALTGTPTAPTASSGTNTTQIATTAFVQDAINPVLATKTYTDIICSANNQANGTFYFASLVPDSWEGQWHVKLRIHTWVPSDTNYDTWSLFEIWGNKDAAPTYYVWNSIKSTDYRPTYYYSMIRLTQAGFNNSYGHIIGNCIYNSTNSTDTTLKRSFKVEVMEVDGGTLTLLDNATLYANVSGTGSTNYNSVVNYVAYAQGLQEVGDTDTQSTLYYSSLGVTAGSNGIIGYNLVMQLPNGKWESINTSAYTAATKIRNTNGFVPGKIVYYAGSSTVAAGNTSSYIAYAMTITATYSTNVTGMVKGDSFYIVGTIGSDGLFYLDETWWATSLPTDEDGRYYMFAGIVYSATVVHFGTDHPIYYYKDGKIQLWTNEPSIRSIEKFSLSNINRTANGKITRLIGETCTWNQLVQNPNGESSDGFTMYSLVTFESLSGCAKLSSSGKITLSTPEVTKGHRYYGTAYIKATNNAGSIVFGVMTSGVSPRTNYSISFTPTTNWTKVSIVTPAWEISSNYWNGFRIGTTDASITGDIYFKNFMIFDLSLMFGVGKEPDAETFEKWLEKNIGPQEYYAYNQGTVLSANNTGFITNGFNQYKNDSTDIDLIYGQQYQLSGTYTSIVDDSNTAITVDADGLFTVDSIDKTIVTITGGDNTTCLHLVKDGSRNGEYEAYHENSHTLNISSITGKLNGEGNSVTVFPDGLCGIRGVSDEIYVENGVTRAIKRIGSIDLGTLTYTKGGANYSDHIFYATINDIKNSSSSIEANIAAIACEIYASVTKLQFSWSAYAESNPELSIDPNGKIIYIKDLAFVDKTPTEVKTLLDGVLLYYELATPEVYVLDNFTLPIEFNVDKWGTCKMLPLGADAPLAVSPSFDVKYKDSTITELKTINNESLIGSGNITISSGDTNVIETVKVNGSTLTPDANKAVDVKTHDAVASHGTSDTTFALTPNVFHTWGEVTSLTLTLATPSDNTIVNEYMFEFQSGSTATTLSLPATVEWDADKGDIDIESGYIYQVSILNNLALWGRKEVTS